MHTRHLATLLICSVLCLVSAPALAAKGDCGQPATGGSGPKSSDALAVLHSAVGAETCEACVCDVNRSGSTTAGDALLTLKKAVGQNVTLLCSDCLATQSIGAAGGTVTSHDGRLVVEVPAGAVASPTEFTIIGVAPPSLPDAFDVADVYEAYEIGPTGLSFDPPLQVTYHLPAETIEVVGDAVTFRYPLLTTATGSTPEQLDHITIAFDPETGAGDLSGSLSHLSPVVIDDALDGGITLEVTPFPANATVGDNLNGTLVVRSEFELPKPSDVQACKTDVLASECGLLCDKVQVDAPQIEALVHDNKSWIEALHAQCEKEGFCGIKYSAEFLIDTGLGLGLIELRTNSKTTCAAPQVPSSIAIPRDEIEDGHVFNGPYGPIQSSDSILALGTKDGSTAFNLDSEQVEFDLGDGNSQGHFGAIPLRICNPDCKEAWVQYGPATGGALVWNWNPMAMSWGSPVQTGGPFNSFEDAMPVDPDPNGFANTVYLPNLADRSVEKVSYNPISGKFEMSPPIVSVGLTSNQNPSSIFAFPNGSMVILGAGNTFDIAGKLYFHPGNNPDTPATPIGEVGHYSRRVRCAMCNGSSIYTCLNSSLVDQKLFVSQVDPSTGSGSITDNQPAGLSPNGVVIFPKPSGSGCYGVVADYSAGFSGIGYTFCEIANNGKASCQSEPLPEDCPDPRFVQRISPSYLAMICEMHQKASIVQVPPPPPPGP